MNPFNYGGVVTSSYFYNWENGISRLKSDIENGNNIIYLELYDHLSQYQKRVLLALVESGDKIFSKNYSEKFSLSSASSTQRAINKLRDIGIIEKEESTYQFSDPFFRRFLQLRFNA